MNAATFHVDMVDDVLRLNIEGDWRARFLARIDHDIRDFEEDSVGRELIIDLSKLERMDTAGALVIQRVMSSCASRTDRSTFTGASDAQMALLEHVRPHLAPCPVEPARGNPFIMLLVRLGVGARDVYFAAIDILNFIGVVVRTFIRAVAEPRRFRLTSIVSHMESAGLDAVPIVATMSFLVGAVVAYMGAKSLATFGAEIFTVELVSLAVLREFGVLLAAILLAGRSGSAFTAQIGSMKLREEIDALRVTGLDPIEVLVLPRTIALIVMLPVLAFIGAMMGLLGGIIVSWGALDISPTLFIARMKEAIVLSNFWAGIIKAPFFAFIISVVGCFQGMSVEGSAESLGQRTTLSVVQSLFLVIFIDSFFAMFYLEIDF
ncbi:MAG: MlaE family lipid ABC transporter permease subunit [Alphaproteobacteria bacterium]|nr:MlaE family lipid ABC transporter permease subunit [Alphaproteobacteria bacterium]